MNTLNSGLWARTTNLHVTWPLAGERELQTIQSSLAPLPSENLHRCKAEINKNKNQFSENLECQAKEVITSVRGISFE